MNHNSININKIDPDVVSIHSNSLNWNYFSLQSNQISQFNAFIYPYQIYTFRQSIFNASSQIFASKSAGMIVTHNNKSKCFPLKASLSL